MQLTSWPNYTVEITSVSSTFSHNRICSHSLQIDLYMLIQILS